MKKKRRNGHSPLPGKIFTYKRYAAYIRHYLEHWNEELNDWHSPGRNVVTESTMHLQSTGKRGARRPD